MGEREKKAIRELIQMLEPLPIGTRVLVRLNEFHELQKGVIIYRFYRKNEGWYYYINIEGTPWFCIRDFQRLQLLPSGSSDLGG